MLTGRTQTLTDYYVGNGVADSTGDLFIEAWCNGGQTETGEGRPALCTRLNLSDCYKVVSTIHLLIFSNHFTLFIYVKNRIWLMYACVRKTTG